ncbi:MAG: hypothetical protein AABX51_06715 [Nanoarchaeota archaeon]
MSKPQPGKKLSVKSSFIDHLNKSREHFQKAVNFLRPRPLMGSALPYSVSEHYNHVFRSLNELSTAKNPPDFAKKKALLHHSVKQLCTVFLQLETEFRTAAKETEEAMKELH